MKENKVKIYSSVVWTLGVCLLFCFVFLAGVNAMITEQKSSDYISFKCYANEEYNTKECSCYTNSLDYHAVNYCDLWLKESRTVIFE